MSEKHLTDAEAIEKLKSMAEDIDFAMMATALIKKPIHMVPMSTKQVDAEGVIWFLSGKDSDHNQHIHEDPSLHLIYSDNGDMQFLNVYGTATITTDKTKLKELYGTTDDNWFDGLDDPNLTAIGVKPETAFYWDPKNGKLVTLFKMGVGAITGNKPELMDQGTLKP